MPQKYKVFIKNKSIILVESFNNVKTTLQYTTYDLRSKNIEGFYDIIKNFTADPKIDELYFVVPDLKIAFKQLLKSFKLIKAAGGLIKNNEGKYLFIYRNNVWDLPKGKIDKFETKRHAAIREVREECGIKGVTVTKKLPPSYHIYSINNKFVIKKTFWYEMYYDRKEKPVPQIEENITEIKWFAKDEIKEALKNTYKLINELVTTYFKY